MKQIKKLFFAAVGVLLPAMAAAETLPVIQNVNAYESLSLNGEWNYIVDVQEEGYYDYRMKPTPWGFFRNAKPQKPDGTTICFHGLPVCGPTLSARGEVWVPEAVWVRPR